MTALRIRPQCTAYAPPKSNDNWFLRSIRAHVEIRPGTGGTGITLSFREEDYYGNGSLFRIENKSPFPIWVAQDGVLANPISTEQANDEWNFASFSSQEGDTGSLGSFSTRQSISQRADIKSEQEMEPNESPARRQSVQSSGPNNSHNGLNGDLILPMEQFSFGLDVPFRQGKYAHRRAATMSELLRLRVGLAPLFSRDGIESTKVIGLSSVGNIVRLSPSRLILTIGDDISTQLLGVRVLGVVCADGPTRVLRFW